MAHTKGRLGKLAVSAAGSTYTDVGGVKNFDLDDKYDATDDTDFDSAGCKESDYGYRQVSLSVTMLRDEADAGQDIIRTAQQAGNKLYFRVRQYEASGSEQYKFLGVITSFKHSNSGSDKVECSFDAESSGAITVDTQ